jgi:tripartite-type tricarboxylate transporter receptor subunit TctC
MTGLYGWNIDEPRVAVRRVACLAVATCALYGATLAVLDGSASGQTFPGRTITIIVPYAPGGPSDVAARVLSEPLAARLGQNVIVENVSGGSALIGTGRVARAAPDGAALLVQNMAIAANVSLFPKASFNVEKDLIAVGLVNYGVPILVGRKSLAANSLAELVAWMKRPGQRIKFAHAGIGTNTHLCAVLLARAVGADIDLIPYRGGAPAITDLLAAHMDLYCTNSAGEQLKAGTVKGFGVASKGTFASYPNLPSLVRSGFADMDIPYWQGMFAPAATPKTILEKLNAALRLALADPKLIRNYEHTDFSVFPEREQTIAAANSFLHQEIVRWGQVVRTNHIEAEQ